MNMLKVKSKYLIALFTIILLVVGGIGVIASKRQQEQAIKIPVIVLKTHSLDIVSTKIIGQDIDTATIAIELKNNSDKSIIAVGIEAGDKDDAVGTTVNGFNDGDEPPSIVIVPHGTITAYFALGNLKHVKPGTPIKVGGVIFADGAEEGDTATLGTMRRQRDHYKNKKSPK